MSGHFRFVGLQEAERLSAFAEPLWRNTYDDMLGRGMSEAIFKRWLSPDGIRGMFSEGYEFAYIEENGEDAGYTAFRINGDMYLSKLYLRPEFRGRGLGVRTLNEIADLARSRGAGTVTLHVNVGNKRAIRVYEEFGFIDEGRDTAPIAGGFCRNDILFVLHLRGYGGARPPHRMPRSCPEHREHVPREGRRGPAR